MNKEYSYASRSFRDHKWDDEEFGIAEFLFDEPSAVSVLLSEKAIYRVVIDFYSNMAISSDFTEVCLCLQ